MTAQKQEKFDVGILGWWYGKNYGSILTYYGLNKAIEGLGHHVLMVHEPLGYNGYRVSWPDDILSMDFARRVGYHYTQQEHYSKLPRLNDRVGTFVVGSDQLWNPQIGRVNDDLFLDFVAPQNRRVAYATSFGNRGTAKFTPEFTQKHSANLQKFDAISVREGYAVTTAETVFGTEATLVLDPVFLLPTSDYQALADQATLKVSGDYLAVFFLDPTPEKRDAAVAIADKLGLQRIVVIPNPDRGRALSQDIFAGPRFEVLAQDAPEIFLYTYSKARYVVTDSFHGTAFAVIFEKPFSSIYNTKRGADRFKNLLGSLGFGESRRVHETDRAPEIEANPNVGFAVDFTAARQHIQTEGAASLQWLQTALARKDGPSRAAVLLQEGTKPAAAAAVAPAPISLGQSQSVERPELTASALNGKPGWIISRGRKSSTAAVTQGGAIRGNQLWCDLPFALREKASYRLTIKWALQTTGGTVNLHIRDAKTAKFQVIGTVRGKGFSLGWRNDSVDFTVKSGGMSQFMLGAVHFSGAKGGVDIASLTLEEISTVAPPVKAATTVAPPTSHAEAALALALHDNQRFTAAHSVSRSQKDGGVIGARARLMFHAHAIEKGLSRSNFRAGFGKIAVPGLAKEMSSWLALGRDRNDEIFKSGASVMKVYFDRHQQANCDVSGFRALFSPEILALIAVAEDSQGGVIAATRPREPVIGQTGGNRSFIDVVYGRRSIRDFTQTAVRNEDIRDAVQIAMQAPSVCNRQSARVRQIDDPRVMKDVIDLQGGFGGYAMPPKLLLISCDLTAFLFATERNQAYIDGGLFMMGLLLGLEQVGLGACSLNTAMGVQKDTAIRRRLGIPESEVFIAFLAVGHYDPQVQVPRSKRIGVDEVLIQHTKR